MKPIILSAFDVRAILDGRKTQLRRVIDRDIVNRFDIDTDGTVYAYNDQETGDSFRPEEIAPYQPGQTLWVRETFTKIHGAYFYRADIHPEVEYLMEPHGATWMPSIHMPKEAARLFLLVKNISVERLRNITEEDAWAEGFEPVLCDCSNRDIHGCTDCMNTGMIEPAMVGFVDTWNEIYAKRGHPWESNPWVWKTEFERTVNS